MRSVKISGILSCLFLLFFTVTAEKNTGSAAVIETNSILASVNGEAISLNDILPLTRNKEYQAYAAYSGKRLEEAVRNLRRDAVNEVINRKLIIKAYRAQPRRIAGSDIEHEVDAVAVRMGCNSRDDFRRRLAENEMDYDELRKELEERMIVQFMLQRQNFIEGAPTPKEIYEYFEAHKDELSGIETYELAMLKLDRNAKAEIQDVSAILANSSDRFTELVRRYNPGNDDGRLGVIEPGKMRIEFSGAIKTPQEGRVYGPIHLEDGVVWLKLLKHNRKAEVSFAEVQEKIVRILEAKRRKQAVEVFTAALRRDAVLEYFF